ALDRDAASYSLSLRERVRVRVSGVKRCSRTLRPHPRPLPEGEGVRSLPLREPPYVPTPPLRHAPLRLFCTACPSVISSPGGPGLLGRTCRRSCSPAG